jgi:hypothetical protein
MLKYKVHLYIARLLFLSNRYQGLSHYYNALGILVPDSQLRKAEEVRQD